LEDRLNSREVFQVAWGLVYKIICAPSDMLAEEIVRAVNLKDPTGISSKWTMAFPRPRKDSWDRTNHKPCEQCENRTHWLMHC
jgi:hypothetical protein